MDDRDARDTLAALPGIVMSATGDHRLPAPFATLVKALGIGWRKLVNVRGWLGKLWRRRLVSASSMLGGWDF